MVAVRLVSPCPVLVPERGRRTVDLLFGRDLVTLLVLTAAVTLSVWGLRVTRR